MPIHALTSMTGAPGVTTLAIAWATVNTRPTLILEADPTGGSPILGGPFRGQYEQTASTLTLLDHLGDPLPEWIWHYAWPLPETRDRKVLPTVASHAQAAPLQAAWPTIAAALPEMARAGIDVLIDLGRYTSAYSPKALLTVADTVLVLTEDTTAALNRTVWAIADLRDELAESGPADRAAVIPVRATAQVGRATRSTLAEAMPYSLHDVATLTAPTPAIHLLPWAPDQAAVYMHGTRIPRGFGTKTYTRAVTALIGAADAHATATAGNLATAGDLVTTATQADTLALQDGDIR